MLIKKQHKKNISLFKKLTKGFTEQGINSQSFENSTITSQLLLLQKQGPKKLSITLKSNGICQVKDATSSIVAIEKLINYLNYICAKQLHTNLELYPTPPILHKTRTLKVLGFFTSSYTNFLSYHKTLLYKCQNLKQEHSLFKKSKRTNCSNNSTSLNKVSPMQSADSFKQIFYEKDLSKFKKCFLLEQRRCFFKLSKKFSSFKALNKKLVQKRKSKKLLTLIRAPFVFKKTREQFHLQKFSSHIVIKCANSAQKDFIIQNLRLLKLPTELKLVSYT